MPDSAAKNATPASAGSVLSDEDLVRYIIEHRLVWNSALAAAWSRHCPKVHGPLNYEAAPEALKEDCRQLVQPSSIDVHIGHIFDVDGLRQLELAPFVAAAELRPDACTSYALRSGGVVAAVSEELFNVPPDVMGVVYPKGSLARRGILL